MFKHENGRKAIFYLGQLNKLSKALKTTGLTSIKARNIASKALQ
jgi:hypothetical protein